MVDESNTWIGITSDEKGDGVEMKNDWETNKQKWSGSWAEWKGTGHR